MKAKELVELLGEELVGRAVVTEAVGDYVGGLAHVSKLAPDPSAPEISFNVKHPTWCDPDGGNEIGVFSDEEILLADHEHHVALIKERTLLRKVISDSSGAGALLTRFVLLMDTNDCYGGDPEPGSAQAIPSMSAFLQGEIQPIYDEASELVRSLGLLRVATSHPLWTVISSELSPEEDK